MLHAGEHAPTFALPDADMETVDVGKLRGKKNVVLYFYPKDGTPGCTIQATEFSDHEDEFTRHDCVVLGVSPDDCLAHAEFRDTNGVSIRLLADTEGEVCRKYGVLEEKAEALALLKRLKQAGILNADWARRDPDLASLHPDPGFQALVGGAPLA